MNPQGTGTPFLKAGPARAVRPGRRENEEGGDEKGVASSASALAAPDSESNCLLERGAKQRGKVAHTARPGKPESHAIHSLVEIREESTLTMQEADEWEEVEMIVDSGASGTVIREHVVRAVEAKNVRSDITYKLADGSKVPHMGENLSLLTRTMDILGRWLHQSLTSKMHC